MKFSIVHASARPAEWEKSALAYFHNASLKYEIEYILVTEPTVSFKGYMKLDEVLYLQGKTSKSSVAHWNLGASEATGDVIILNSDDMFPPKDWDQLLYSTLLERCKRHKGVLEPKVVRVSYAQEQQKGLMTLQVMTKAYYDKLGYAMYPGFQSVYADDDFTACAEELKAIIEAPTVVWEHRHPCNNGVKLKDIKDEVYKTENERARYFYGKQLFELRRRIGYKVILGLEEPKKTAEAKIVALCTPGKTFDSDFMFEFGQLEIKCYSEGGVIHGPSTSCNVYSARSECVEAVMSLGMRPDYFFWIDSDQLNMVEAYTSLKKVLEENPEIDVVAGWTYMLQNRCINAGFFYKDENGLVINKDNTFKAENLKPGSKTKFYGELLTSLGDTDKPIRVDWVGFGCVLMRTSVIERMVPDMFTPLYFYKDKAYWVADDTGFCLRCLDKGIGIYLDPNAYVKHIKGQEVLPEKSMVAS